MKTHLSALMDGELEEHEVKSLLAAIAHDEHLQADWYSYHLIGDALRQEGNLHLDVSARVMTALQNEPTVLAPAMRLTERAKAKSPWQGPMAMAASLAGVSVVAWLAGAQLPGAPATEKIATAIVNHSIVDHASVKPVALAAGGNMQEYLVAHQTHSLSGQMQSGTLYIRTVSAER
jgi:sigma-E factor negative regulatory protein RseA